MIWKSALFVIKSRESRILSVRPFEPSLAHRGFNIHSERGSSSMANVYFHPIDSYQRSAEIRDAARNLLERLLQEEGISLESMVPLKVHFGERGNTTYIHPQNYDGVIDLLAEKGVSACFMETNAVYSGSRMRDTDHQKLAADHGFIRLPTIIADGRRGEAFEEIRIGKKHFQTCKIARGFVGHQQLLVLSHFKGHALAGFGGAIKQLAMGFAARGGKLAQHIDAKPFIIPFVCKECRACAGQCPEKAITFGFLPKIHHSRCIGCAACIAVCPHTAIFVNPLKINLADGFREKMTEYALAAQLGKKHLYLNFAFNITDQCDCIGKSMQPIARDIGVFASTDPVAIDKACLDLLDQREGKTVFAGRNSLAYGESIGLGSQSYRLVTTTQTAV